ncbi:hypothetical protein BSZ36_10760 [Rubricoccus marinus]|uniref:NodB homology domain-containing protein n=1 Tax=Rubricoccus marinus TaxID=716817 RepID=A0A259U4E1_9BACT|nr:hypothetical protein BSZ36_10760 [Rubricoccus marinus]
MASGAFVLSVDFELHWGVRDHTPPEAPYAQALRAARGVVTETLRRFETRGVACTWATVGFLFARTRDEQEALSPASRPAYADAALDPYAEPVGSGESEDPLHFAASLVDEIRAAPRQELATHTFSHYYCGEPGATPETFRADLRAAQKASGEPVRSIVFPRNQSGDAFLAVLPDVGIDVYRGNPEGRLWRAEDGAMGRQLPRRLARLADSYLPVRDDVVRWDSVLRPDGLADVRASQFLRPVSPRLAPLRPLHLRRLRQGMTAAARRKQVYHLWWHPHNFGTYPEESLRDLDALLDHFERLRDRYGFASLTMAEVADAARRRNP